MVNMAKNNGNYSLYPRPTDRVYFVNNGFSQKGHGVGGIFQGWANRAIPIIKTKAKSLGKDLAIQGLDSIYEVGRDYLVNKIGPTENDNNKFVSASKKNASRPKKSIKRKNPSKPFSRSRNVKRKRPNKNFTHGFRKVKSTDGFQKVTL